MAPLTTITTATSLGATDECCGSMRLIPNAGTDRVIDNLQQCLGPGASLAVATSAWSIFAFGELREHLSALASARVAISAESDLQILGGPADRVFRNRLQSRWLARLCHDWIIAKAEIRALPTALPQTALITDGPQPSQRRAITGPCAVTMDGLGIVPGNRLSLIQCADSPEEWSAYQAWFDALWSSLPTDAHAKQHFLAALETITAPRPPTLIYHHILHQVLGDQDGALDEDRVIKAATGIKETAVWQRLYRFQRDGVVGAIDKLERHNGCIIADSVGLGKTFEALAVIKYYELRNDRVLVLCPKRLRDNWLMYRINDRRNILASDRFNYDVLNHTDLSRDTGMSGDIDLAQLNWGNYDLVVIDESHNFRNKGSHNDRETRYGRLMRRIITEGVKTRVLMLSATPVNNRLADLKNQIAFIAEGRDHALSGNGIASIDTTTRLAQTQFNRWLELPDELRTSSRLLDMLGFDYFKLLDLVTIARSRKHIEKYYGTAETGKFPERLPPINIKTPTDENDEFPAIQKINDSICRLHLGAYAPMRYLLPHKQAAYDAKYSVQVRGGKATFRQVDREESLVHLMRVNLLKRMESSVFSFALTLSRQLRDIDATLSRLDSHETSFDEIAIEDIDVDDPRFEPLLVGKRVKVLLQDVDRIRWKQDLSEDRTRIAQLLDHAKQVSFQRDAKLIALRNLLIKKIRNPINPGNRKVLIFTAFADTALYLYEHLAQWLRAECDIESALVTGTGTNRCTIPAVGNSLSNILTAFSPRSKERPQDTAADGDIDVIIATDCISEGQNLQDCDFLVNFDIHWNPVRIIQRFGRIDRIGSPNTRIQLVNFWPNVELEEYINLEQRVSGRMVLLDVSATGEENLIDQRPSGQMNDLEYRRKQLEQLQHTVIDLEDLSNGISIADLTLNDFRIDLADYLKSHGDALTELPLGVHAVVSESTLNDGAATDARIPPGVIVCLRSDAALDAVDPAYPLAPHYLLHVGPDGTVLLAFPQAKTVLDRLRRIAQAAPDVDAQAWATFDRRTRQGQDMTALQRQVAAAAQAVAGKTEERAVASLFTPGGTAARKGDWAGLQSFEIVAFVVVLGASGAGSGSRPASQSA